MWLRGCFSTSLVEESEDLGVGCVDLTDGAVLRSLEERYKGNCTGHCPSLSWAAVVNYIRKCGIFSIVDGGGTRLNRTVFCTRS